MVKAFEQEETSKKVYDLRTAAASHHPYTSSTSLSTSESIQNNHDDYLRTAVATAAAVTPPAPKCWRNAMHLLLWQDYNDSFPIDRKHGPHQDATILCQSLPDSHQKLLALEIARCHMADLGRDLFSTPIQRANVKETTADESTTTTKDVNGGGTAAGQDLERSNCHEPLTNVDDMYYCLKYLTDSGTNAYTQYVAYVQLLCTRLTQEVFLAHQQDVQQEMARRYQDVASQSVSHMETIHSLAKLQTDQFHAMATELPEQIREKMTLEIQERLSARVDEHLDEHLGARLKVQVSNLTHAMQEQATNQALALQLVWEQVAVRERQEQTAWWQNSSRQLQEEQRKAMKRAWERLDALLLRQTSTTGVGGIMSDGRMQSIMAGLEFLLTTVTRGYSWLAFLLYFVTTLNMIWLFTRPRICHGFRAHLFAMVFFEAAAELVLLFLVEQNLGVVTEWQRVGLVQELRRWTIFLECTILAIGLLASMFFGAFTRKPRLQPPLTEPTMFVNTAGTVQESSFPPVRGSTSNGNVMRVNHEQHQQHQQHHQQQQHLLHFNTNSVAHQQPFGPTPQVTPPKPPQQPLQPQQPVYEQSMYYSPIAGGSRGRAIFGRGGANDGTTPTYAYHHQPQQYQQQQQQHHHQFQSPTPFAPMYATQQQQQQQQLHHHQPQQQQPMPPPLPVIYPHYYSSPLPSRPIHGSASTWTNHINAAAATNNNNAAHDGRSFPYTPLDPEGFSRARLHPRRDNTTVQHHEQQQPYHQHQYYQPSPSVAAASPFAASLARRDNNNNNNSSCINNNNPHGASRTTKVAAAAVTTTTQNGGSSSSRARRRVDDGANDKDDEFMDALCEIPNDDDVAGSAVTTAGRPIPTTTTTTTTRATTTTIVPTRDCWIHENAVMRTMIDSASLSRNKRHRRTHDNNQEEVAAVDSEEDDDDEDDEKRNHLPVLPRQKKQAKK
jgi:hypothetical protein